MQDDDRHQRTAPLPSLEPLRTGATRMLEWPHAEWVLRGVWVLFAAGALALAVGGAPYRVDQLLAHCNGPCAPDSMTPEQLEALASAGLSPRSVVWYLESLALLMVAMSTGIAAVLLWRRPRGIITIVASCFLVAVAASATFNPSALATAVPRLEPWVRLFALFTDLLIPALLLLFPNGRFEPRWTRWVFGGFAAYRLLVALAPASAWAQLTRTPSGSDAAMPLIVLFALAVQTYRLFRISNSVDRQRGKWALWAIFVHGVVFTIGALTLIALPANEPTPLIGYAIRVALYHGWVITFLLIPLAICFSILRYRLWDIDLILHRSLTYGVLTFTLVALFGMSVAVLNGLSRALAGEGQRTIVTGASMLLVGALFQPTRRQLRRTVDRAVFGIGLDYHRTAPSLESSPILSRLERTQALAGLSTLHLVGKGGMAEVYRATHESGTEVAVKVLRLESDNEESVVRFEREAEIVGTLDHPNIVRMLGYRTTSDGLRVMLMEYVSQQTLSQLLSADGLPLELALEILSDLCSALDYAHGRGIVHRDIKPSNVLIARLEGSPPRYRAVLTDFGIAKLDTATQLTKSQLIGTVTHMSPEQIRDPAHVDRRSDIYSMGVLAFQLFTGRVPFDARSATAVLLAHLQQPAPDPRRFRPDLPSNIARAVLRALAKSPSSRFGSAGEMLRALQQPVSDRETVAR